MKDLNELLRNVPGAYDDFVIAMSRFATKSDYRTRSMIDYIESNPNASTSDIIGYATFELDLLSDSVSGLTIANNQNIAMA